MYLNMNWTMCQIKFMPTKVNNFSSFNERACKFSKNSYKKPHRPAAACMQIHAWRRPCSSRDCVCILHCGRYGNWFPGSRADKRFPANFSRLANPSPDWVFYVFRFFKLDQKVYIMSYNLKNFNNRKLTNRLIILLKLIQNRF